MQPFKNEVNVFFYRTTLKSLPDYARRCRTSTLIMVPINFWRNSDPFKKKKIFLTQQLTMIRHFGTYMGVLLSEATKG